MNRSSRKKLKDTKVGGWLREKSPKILGIVGDLLPESGILGVIKNLVDSDPNITHDPKRERVWYDLGDGRHLKGAK